jgi:molybdate transport system substrate-binding protein
MKRSTFVAAALVLTLCAPAIGRAADTGTVVVYAAASLREAFDAAGAAFKAKTGIAVTFDYGGSDTLAAQIAQGAPVDVFASANVKQMEKVASAGLLAGDAVTFARNRLVAIVPKANPGKVTAVFDLARPGTKVVLAAAAVPVGGYARAAFAAMNGRDGAPPDFAGAVEKNVISGELDVKAVATKIALGEGDAGVVYATDVTPTIADQVTVLQFPPAASPDAIYPIAVLKAAPDASAAQTFVTYILHDGQTFLKARGFLAP